VKEVMRKRFIADCGRGFWVKSKCETHEVNCTCWKNPRNQTCKTCVYATPDRDDSRNTYYECGNPNFTDHTNELGLDYISVKCPLWSGSKESAQ